MAEQPRRYVDEKGRLVDEYPSGLIRDVTTGHIIAPPRLNVIRSSQRGRELARKRHTPIGDWLETEFDKAVAAEKKRREEELRNAEGNKDDKN